MLLLRTLGTVALEREGDAGPETVLRPSKPLALLIYLAAHEGRSIARDTLADLLWREEATERARASLRQALHTLRRTLGDAAIVAERETVSLAPETLIWDAARFDAAAAAADLPGIVDWYRGALAERFPVRGFGGFEPWVAAERERLRRLLLAAAPRALAAATASGALESAASAARALLQAEPALDGLVPVATDALLAHGDFAAARAVLEAARARAVAAGDTVPPAVAERLGRLTQAERQQLTAAQGARDVLGRRLVGRDDLLASLFRALDTARLANTTRVALIGPPGIGKTRLLNEFEARLRPRGTRLVRVRLLPPMREIPGSGLADLVRELAALSGAMGVSETSAETLVTMLPQLQARFASAEPAIIPESEWTRRRADAIADLLAAVAEERLTVLLVDDDQYLDATSRAVMEEALRRPDLRLLEVRSSRLALAGDGITRLFVPPLSESDVRALLEGDGSLPSDAWVAVAVRRLVAESAGIPQVLLQRLRGWQAAGILVLQGGTWIADAEALAVQTAGPPAELTDVLAALSAEAWRLLRLLALWRLPVPEQTLAAVTGAASARGRQAQAWRHAMDELEWRGLVVADAGTWAIAHETIVDLVLAQLPPAEARQLLLELASHAVGDGRLTVPVLEHLAILAGSRRERALLQFVVREAARDPSLRRFGLRGQALADYVAQAAGRPEWAPELLSSIGWLGRTRRRVVLLVGGLSGAVLAAGVWLTVMLWPRLVIEAVPMADGWVSADHPNAAFAIQPRIGVYDGFGRLREGYRGSIRVEALGRKLAGDTVRAVDEGRVQFEHLTFGPFLSPEAASAKTVTQLRFHATGLARSLTVSVPGAFPDFRDEFRIVRLSVNGEPADLRQTHRLPVRDSLVVTVTYEFTTTMSTANYIVGAAPTWEPRETSSIRLAGLPRPVARAWQTRTISLKAPDAPGLQHLLVVMAPEDHVDNVFSGTSWTIREAPIWHDGNDLVDLPLVRKRELRDTFRTVSLMRFAQFDRRQSDVVFGDQRITRPPVESRGQMERETLGYALELEFYEP